MSRGFQSCPVVESQPSVAAHHGSAAPTSGDQVLFTSVMGDLDSSPPFGPLDPSACGARVHMGH